MNNGSFPKSTKDILLEMYNNTAVTALCVGGATFICLPSLMVYTANAMNGGNLCSNEMKKFFAKEFRILN